MTAPNLKSPTTITGRTARYAVATGLRWRTHWRIAQQRQGIEDQQHLLRQCGWH
jgi:hypothetical protein